MTSKQKALAKKHGTPAEFAKACYEAVPGDISMDEARAAVDKYTREWTEAGLTAKDKRRVEIRAALQALSKHDETMKALLETRRDAVRCIKAATRRNDLTVNEAIQVWKILGDECERIAKHF